MTWSPPDSPTRWRVSKPRDFMDASLTSFDGISIRERSIPGRFAVRSILLRTGARSRSLDTGLVWNGYLAESTLRFAVRNHVWGRIENVDRTNELLLKNQVE